MTQQELEKLKERLISRIGGLENVMRNARKDKDVYNYLYYDGEINACYRLLQMLNNIESEHSNKEQNP